MPRVVRGAVGQERGGGGHLLWMKGGAAAAAAVDEGQNVLVIRVYKKVPNAASIQCDNDIGDVGTTNRDLTDIAILEFIRFPRVDSVHWPLLDDATHARTCIVSQNGFAETNVTGAG